MEQESARSESVSHMGYLASDGVPDLATRLSTELRPRLENRRLLFVINDLDFFVSHRLPIATAARALGMKVDVAAADGVAASRLRAEGLMVHAVPITRSGINPFQELKTLWRLYRLFRHLQPDLIHTVTIKAVLYGGIAARLAGARAVVSAIPGLGHVFVRSGLFSSLWRRLVLIGYRLALRQHRGSVIFQNPENRETLIRAGVIPQSDTVLIRGAGVDMNLFRPAPERSGPIVIVLAARLLWSKGVGDFVAAARQLVADGVTARFVLVGAADAGNPSSISQQTLRMWHEQGVVEWWGMRSDMDNVFANCHIVCLPTVYGEGVPKVLIEAAASGRPIVATDVPGCREVVHDERNGLLVPPSQVTELVRALKRLIENPALRQEMGRKGRELVEREFSVERVVEETLRLYRGLVA